MQSSTKPQFASWLLEQLQTGQYPGLCYVSRNRFRVPWKHNSRKDCNDEDNKIFRAWAVASGKIHEFPTDKARWKTNFRCALNNLSVRFKMFKDNSKNSDDPHKIYEIVNTEQNSENLPNFDYPDDADMIPDIYCSPTENFPGRNEYELLSHFMALDLGNHPSDGNYAPPPAMVPHHPAAPNISHVVPHQPSCYEPNPAPALMSTSQPTIYDLEISIHYRKREMLITTLNAYRLQLHYQHADPELNAHPICFPSTESILDQKQAGFTNRILSSIQKGLTLEVCESGIYALRQGKCHVFASTSDPNWAHPDPKTLPPNTVVELLSFRKYANELKQFKEQNGGSPEYAINMCFGEKFPDGKPLEKKLVVVKVVPLICRYFHEMAQAEGASSLHSSNVSLQMSHNSLQDLINSVFGLPEAEEPARADAHYLQQM